MNAPCPLCGACLPDPFLVRRRTPAMQNALADTRPAALAASCGSLAFACCAACGFVSNTAFDPDLTAYDQQYENSQHHSPSFSRYIDDLVERIAHRSPRTAHVVEIGCGKGVFLRRLIDRLGDKARGTGYDPAYDGPLDDGRIRFERRFYGRDHSGDRADVIICRHVIEHIEDPLAMLRAVRSAIVDEADALVVFETPCVDWILRHGVGWDFFHEHCSLFSASSLRHAFAVTGFLPGEVQHLFGGQYLLLAASPGRQPAPPLRPSETPALAQDFAGRSAASEQAWRAMLDARCADGPVVVWGAGAKGVTLLNLLDPGARRIAAVIDINPRKQGRFIPGTGHACLAPDALCALGARTALVTNPNYLDEVRACLSRTAPSCQAIDLMGDAT